MSYQPTSAETIGARVEKMKDDVCEIAHAFNLDESYETALAAQKVILALDELEDQLQKFGAELEWGWRPTPRKDRV